jgi:arginine/ornithine transport system permease protein
METILQFLSEAGQHVASFIPLNFGIIFENWPLFLRGFLNTIALVIVPLVLSSLLAIPLAMIRVARVPILNGMVFAYTYVFRGTPLLVQLYLLYFGTAQFDSIRHSILWVILRSAWWCAMISTTLCSTAYITEILRGAIETTPRGELEAADASGMSRFQRFRRIVLPSAVRRSLPPYSNEVIFTLHGSVVASTITIVDVLGAGRLLNNKYYVAFEGFIAAAVIYLALTFIITRLFNLFEKKYLGHLRPRSY